MKENIHNIILGVVGTLALIIFNDMRTDLGSLAKNVQELNGKIVKVISDQGWHKKQLDRHDARITKLENY